jgi:glutathione S-transferase
MRAIGDRMATQMFPFAKLQIDFLESELGSTPGGGPYMCGSKLTAADILLSFPLQAGRKRLGITEDKYPRLIKYIDLLESLDGYKRGVKKIEEVDGKSPEEVTL